ncbi:MAG: DUF998 domain-containing protein [Pseudorhizobium sp.]
MITRKSHELGATLIIVGVAFAVVADVVSWFLAEGYDPIRMTISTLAVGRASWLIDLGLLSFAASCVLTAAGLATTLPKGGIQLVAWLSFLLLGADVAWISFLNEYAGSSNAAADLHTWGVYALYVLFAVGAFSAASSIGRSDASAASHLRLLGLLWVVLGPVYYFWYPSAFLGAFGRLLALLMILCVVAVARSRSPSAVLRTS